MSSIDARPRSIFGFNSPDGLQQALFKEGESSHEPLQTCVSKPEALLSREVASAPIGFRSLQRQTEAVGFRYDVFWDSYP